MVSKKIKVAVFYFIVFLPSFIAAWILIDIAGNVYRINSGIDYGDMYANVKEYLGGDRGKAEAVLEDGELTLRYECRYPDGERKKYERKLAFSPGEKDRLIYVYGSSPVVAKPPFFKGEFNVFSVLLERELNGSGEPGMFRVYNFGLTSMDSFAIKEIVEVTTGIRRPDLIVYYYGGGMDFESAYYAARVKQQHYPLSVVSLGGFSRTPFLNKVKWWRSMFRYGGWFNRTYLQTYLINFLQSTGLLKIRMEQFNGFNALIYRDIEQNIRGVAAIARQRNIPVIFVMSLSNLEAKPFGTYDLTQKYYEAGMAEEDFRKRYDLLMRARDSELFTGDLGPRSEVSAMFHDLGREDMEGVYVMDLPGRMVDSWRGFDYVYFYDYGHMRPSLHGIVAGELYGFMKSNGIIDILKEKKTDTEDAG